MFEDGLGRGAHRCLVRDAEPGELVERDVVGVDGLVGGFEEKGGHGWLGWRGSW